MEAVLFYASSAVAILGSLMVILLSKPTRALLSLILAMTAITVLYLLLNAHFVAIAQIIVYAGAVLVLFLFVIMLQGTAAVEIPLLKRFPPLTSAAGILAVLIFLSLFIRAAVRSPEFKMIGAPGDVKSLGLTLFSGYLLPFQLTSILLLLSVFAAVALAKKEDA
ncbi:MAG: NADH-quinone oxidoreductase subunit J [Candidatus Omnitrophica bacterium]|nr:NADH-quinone oxidoreductase subunit J [Candidatus Omnitrophota bacterium]